MKTLTRDDTVHGEEYVRKADALDAQLKQAPVLLTDEEIDDVYIEGKRVWLGKLKIARAIESAVLRKNGWGG